MANRYWVGGAVNNIWNNAANWGSASNTRDSAGIPTAADDIIFDGSANGNTACTIDIAAVGKSIDFSGGGGGGGSYTNTVTHNASITLTIGSAGQTGGIFKLVSGMTYTLGSNTTSIIAFGADSGTNALTSAGKTLGQMTVAGAGSTVQLVDGLTLNAASTLTLTSAFDANGQAVSAGFYDLSSTAVRTVTLGANTWTVTGVTGTVWNVTTSSNLTLTTTGSTVAFVATATGVRNLNFGNKTYNIIHVNNPSWNAFTARCDISGQTFNTGTLTLTNVGSFQITNGATCTITGATGAFSTNASRTNQTLIQSGGASAGTFALTNAQTLDWVYLRFITATTAALSARNSFDGGSNTLNGGTITPPPSVQIIGC